MPSSRDTAASPPTPHTPNEWHAGSVAFLAEQPAETALIPGTLPARTDLAESFRHSGWMPARKKVETALRSIPGISPRRISAFCYCGCDAYVEAQTVGHDHKHTCYRVKSTKCHDRFCVPCSNERSLRIKTALLHHMYQKNNLSLITLTLAIHPEPLTARLDRLMTCFRQLRQWPAWKKAIAGGAHIIESKVADDGTCWNVHLHIVAEAKYLDQSALSAQWHKITGDSYIVDVRRVGAKSGAVQYITKYVTKAADPSIVNSPRHLQEAITAFTGRRLVSTFGTWRGLKLMESTDDSPGESVSASSWQCVGRLDEIIRDAYRGDPTALRIMRAIAPRKLQIETPARAPP